MEQFSRAGPRCRRDGSGTIEGSSLAARSTTACRGSPSRRERLRGHCAAPEAESRNGRRVLGVDGCVGSPQCAHRPAGLSTLRRRTLRRWGAGSRRGSATRLDGIHGDSRRARRTRPRHTAVGLCLERRDHGGAHRESLVESRARARSAPPQSMGRVVVRLYPRVGKRGDRVVAETDQAARTPKKKRRQIPKPPGLPVPVDLVHLCSTNSLTGVDAAALRRIRRDSADARTPGVTTATRRKWTRLSDEARAAVIERFDRARPRRPSPSRTASRSPPFLASCGRTAWLCDGNH
jgi:hypothetical protein